MITQRPVRAGGIRAFPLGAVAVGEHSYCLKLLGQEESKGINIPTFLSSHLPISHQQLSQAKPNHKPQDKGV